MEKHLITLPRQLDLNVLKQMKLNLDDTENLLGKIASHHRVQTWKEKATEWLQYIGYVSIGLIGIFTLYKREPLDIITKCIPKNLCLICVKTQVQANSTIYYATAPTQDTIVEQTMPIKNRRVRF